MTVSDGTARSALALLRIVFVKAELELTVDSVAIKKKWL